jgi:MarR family transcriptional regulator, organic hydroperoxide resistance regulator
MTDPSTLAETERAMRNKVSGLELDFEAAHAVSSIYRAANAVRGYVTNEVLRPAGLTWTGFVVMWVVWIWDGVETRRAAESAAISKATLTGVVKTLEARGWLERRGSEGDRRLVELRLTPTGKALMEDLYPKFNAIEARVVAGLSPSRQQSMTKSLRGIVTSIEGMGGSASGDE